MTDTDMSVVHPGGLSGLVASGRDFARWWQDELRAVVPAGWMGGEAVPKLFIWRDQHHIVCTLTSGTSPVETRFPIGQFDSGAPATWLEQLGLRRDQVALGPALPSALFFRRDMKVPRAALGSLSGILDQEVLRRTPFQLSDIWHAAVPVDSSKDPVAMHHWMIRKDRTDAFLAELGLTQADIDFLGVQDECNNFVSVVSFREALPQDPAWARRAIKGLAIGGLCMTLLGLLAFEVTQASVASDMEASLIEARQGAQGGSVQPAARLFAMKADTSTLDIWEELSRILPDHTFLTEVRIAETGITLSGLSSDAARLVRTIDQSPLFSGAALTSAITPDAAEHKDRFSISFKVRRAQAAGAAPIRRSPAS